MAVTALQAQNREETLSNETLISYAAGNDSVKREKAFHYIDTMKPADLPDAVGEYILGRADAEEKIRATEILQHYSRQLSVKIYIHVLEKTSSSVLKKQIIDILGKTNDRSMVIAVSKELASPFFAVRESAILALKELGDDRMFPAIFAMAENKDPVYRVYALESLYYLYDFRLFSIVQSLLQDENKSVRLLAIKCMAKNGLDKLIPNLRTIALSDSNMEVRIEAVTTLGKMNDTAGLSVIIKTCASENRNLRLASAKVLYKFKAKQSAYPASEQLAAETDNEIRTILLDTLIDMRDGGGFKGIEKVLSDESALTLRIRAAYGLGLIGGPKAVPLLAKSLKDSDYRVRAESGNSLGYFKDRTVMQLLHTAIKDDKERYVRLAALYSLERLRDKASIIPLFDLYSNEKDPVFRMKLFEITRTLIQNMI